MIENENVRVLLMPRWSGTADDDWYPWLRGELDVPITTGRLVPAPGAPVIAACVAELARMVGTGSLEQTVLVGHSVGCQAVLRFVAGLPEGARVGAIVCVAGWFSVDQPWPTIRPWIDTPIDDARVRQTSHHITVLLSDDDPFTADHAANGAAWRGRLGAAVTVVPGARHFNAPEAPAVRHAIREALTVVHGR